MSVERARSSVSGEVEWLVPANHAATAGRRHKHRSKHVGIYQRQEAQKNQFYICKGLGPFPGRASVLFGSLQFTSHGGTQCFYF